MNGGVNKFEDVYKKQKKTTKKKTEMSDQPDCVNVTI